MTDYKKRRANERAQRRKKVQKAPCLGKCKTSSCPVDHSDYKEMYSPNPSSSKRVHIRDLREICDVDIPAFLERDVKGNTEKMFVIYKTFSKE